MPSDDTYDLERWPDRSAAGATLQEVLALASKCGWKRTAQFCDAALDADRHLLVAADEGTEAAEIASWLAAQLPGHQIDYCSLGTLTGNAATVLNASRVVALFGSGKLMTAAGVAGACVALSRPAATTAVVFTGVPALADPEDLARLERAVWRLLAGDEAHSNPSRQRLADRHVYLWEASTGGSPGWARSRLDQDLMAFSAWLRQPQPGRELALAQALCALELAAEDQLATGAPPDGHQPDMGARNSEQVATLIARLNSLRSILLARFDADAGLVREEVRASVAKLELDLLQGLDGYLRANDSELAGAEGIRATVSRYITAEVLAWQDKTTAQIAARAQRLPDEVASVLSGVDWDLINHVTGQPEGTYPGEITRHAFMTSASRTTPDVLSAFQALNDPTNPGPQTWERVARVAAGGILLSAISVVAASVLSVPLAPLGAGVAGLAGAGWLDWERTAHRRRAVAEEYGRRAVLSLMAKAEEAATTAQVYEGLSPVRAAIDHDLTRVIEALRGAEGTPGRQPAPDPAVVRLTQLRRQLTTQAELTKTGGILN
jgi:hypothetical protein